MSEQDPMGVLDAWIVELCADVELDAGLVDRATVLSLAGDAAHAVVRPAAPVTTYVLGLLVGRAVAAGADPTEAHQQAVRQVAAALADRPVQE